jgi:formimidoylglutamate deiminase
MAGLTEHGAPGRDDFWTWRTLMYGFASELSPEELEAIATQLYIEMLKAGYTSVCEFHYLHHAPDGRPYGNRIEMCERLIAAARKAGIGLTLLPVLYEYSGFGSRPPLPEQRRFIVSADDVLSMLAELRSRHPQHQHLRYGVAPHSLRAASAESLRTLLEGLDSIDSRAPIHLHVAEQIGEVTQSMEVLGAPPVAWLLDRFAVDARWCLVHATHMTPEEALRVARSGATVALCPTTEANLGDGIFDAARYFASGGTWAIGSDSHVSVDAREELRWLEYVQRLTHRRRNVLSRLDMPQLAQRMYLGAVSGGATAASRGIRGLAVGESADLLVLDGEGADGWSKPTLALPAWLFGNHPQTGVRDVMVGGRWVVQAGRHNAEEKALGNYRRTRDALLRRTERVA